MAWKWYGVKSLYRVAAVGKPRATDEHFDPSITLVEERIVLFRARSFDEALDKGWAEAKTYAEDIHYNPYGQRVKMRCLRHVDAFELFDPPGKGIEVYSSNELVKKSVSDRSLISQHFGTERRISPLRKNFLNREFSGEIRPDT